MTVINDTIAWLTDPLSWIGPNGIPTRMAEHIVICGLSMVIALIIAMPAGLYIGHTGRFARLAVNLANLWRALPSLAVIAIVLPLTARIDPQLGFKVIPTVVAMIVLAVPPILVNTYSGLQGVDSDVREAGRGQGMSEWQLLSRIEVPLAVPAINTGISSATVQVIATATLGAIFGFGGLGRYLIDGLSQGDIGQTVGGAVLVGALVLTAEAVFAVVGWQVTPRALRGRGDAIPEPAG
jgi:osmoprotectant transport system permease protein